MNSSPKQRWRTMVLDGGGKPSDPRNRRKIAGVAVLGTGLLGLSLSSPPDSARFYGLTLASAATFTVGALASAAPSEPAVPARRGVLGPILIGVGAFGVFYSSALLARRIPFLRTAIASVLQYAERGPTPPVLLVTLASGAAEEVFFRGAVYAAAGRYPIPVSTAVYMASTTATRNPALVLASSVMGALFAAQRRSTGGVRAPLLTHLTWSALMIHYLPPLFSRSTRGSAPK